MFVLQQRWAVVWASCSFIFNIWEVVPTHPASEHKYSFCCQERQRGWARLRCLTIFFVFFSSSWPLLSRTASVTMLALITPRMFPLHPSFSLFSPCALLSLPVFHLQLSRCFSFSLLTPLPFLLPLFARTHLVLELTLTPLSLCFFMCSQLGTLHPPLRPCSECCPPQTDSSAEGWRCHYVSPHAARPLCCENSRVFFPEPQVHQGRNLFLRLFFVALLVSLILVCLLLHHFFLNVYIHLTDGYHFCTIC